MTKRQEAVWLKKMIDLERQLILHYRQNPEDDPDGSFAMNAFKSGYWLAKRTSRKGNA